MNNEERILSILESMQGNIEAMQGDVSAINGRLSKLDERVSKLEEGQARLEYEVGFVRSVSLRMEINHGQKLAALFDGYAANEDKPDEHTAILERLEDKIDRLDTVTGVHDLQLKRLSVK